MQEYNERKTVNMTDVMEEQTHLNKEQKSKLITLLTENMDLFEGKKGTWPEERVHIDLKPNAKLFQVKPYRIPQALLPQFKRQIQEMENDGTIKKVKEAKCVSTSFAIKKKEKSELRIVTNFRKLNQKIEQKHFPLPNIREVITSIGRLTYATGHPRPLYHGSTMGTP